MSFDGLITRAAVWEMQTLIGGRINKIYQPSENELLLQVRAQQRNHLLLISAHPSYSRIHLTRHMTDNPLEPPMFCMLMRKHCEGGIITAIEQVDMERIVHIRIRARDDLGDDVTRLLVAEIMGRHSNIILVDPKSNRIIDAVRRVTHAVNRYRQILPGATYRQPPAQNKRHPLTANEETFIRSLDFNQGRLDRQIVDRFSGIGPVVAKEIVHRAGLGERSRLWHTFSEIMADIRQHRYHPTIVVSPEQKTFFSVVALTHLKGETQTFDRISSCLDAFYHGKAERDRVRQQTLDLERKLKNEIDKNEKKIQVLEREIREAEKAENARIYGELLTAYLHQIQRGDRVARVINYYDPATPEIEIPLDPQLTPSENAQRYFKQYNKAKATRKWNEEQMEKARQDIAYLESVLALLENASLKEVDQIREELEEEGWLRPSGKGTRKRKKEAPSPTVYHSSEGIPILVGKNNKQNDYLTHHLASSGDTWLHTKDIPGSHVVIRARTFGEQTLHEAATLAAYFSKARHSSQVPVDYTLVKYVRKPSGARPGFVIYDHQKTLFVTPDESLIGQLTEKVRG